ncbi:hypothetical protein L6452_03014 [Arctium lappa]|uniref:Uncharacterized protein n=1 Tax=Arctium lappa TaxID=4217 RepID=A0ACB9FM23_ARCLA|nr:hypothetical protein L6452_03014 [Arctium lappa]
MGLARDYIRPKDSTFQGIPPHIENDKDIVFNVVQQHGDYIPMEELDGETSSNQGNMRGSSNGMREIRNNIANNSTKHTYAQEIGFGANKRKNSDNEEMRRRRGGFRWAVDALRRR